MTSRSPKPISIAYSPDTDDAFMIWALKEKRIPWGPWEFSFRADDIQALNVAAREGVYDITAISVAAYPSIMDQYAMMTIGGSVARDKGPAIIVSPESELGSPDDLAGKRVATPGQQTSASLAARIVLPQFTEVPTPFHEIADAVRSGRVNAGILIHELQLNPAQEGFRVLGHLGDLWAARFELPLPLGANAIRRTLGSEAINDLTQCLRDSVLYALTHRDEALTFARHAAMTQTNQADADRYINQFVNDDSLAIQRDLVLAIRRLYLEGSLKNLLPEVKMDSVFSRNEMIHIEEGAP